ncbi:MAG: proton-conducting transporter transmembrane domain-containing protein [Candidatus Humimicrobiaceae bacterium]
MELLNAISSYLNPAGVFAFLVLGIIILLFFGISKKEWTKLFSFVLVSVIFIIAFIINIIGYSISGDFSNSLFTSGTMEIFEIAIILFFSIVCLVLIFIFNRKNENFVKIMMIFLFLVISIMVLIVSKNFMSFIISLTCFLIAFFAISTILNDKSIDAKAEATERKILIQQSANSKSVVRFSITSLFFIVLLFFGFSILYGISDVKNFLQLYQDIESSGINIILSLIIISIAFYIYLGMFPFQAPYINFTNKAEPSSVYLLWLFYFPAGTIALLKFIPIISILNKNVKAGSYILYILLATVLLSSVGSGLAGLKTKSLKKIAAYFFTLIIAGYFINMILIIAGFIQEDRLDWLNVFYLLFIGSCFLPVAFIFTYIESKIKKDDINEISNLICKDKIICIAYLISMLSLIGIPGFFGFAVKKYYFDVIVSTFGNGLKGLLDVQGWLVLIILVVYLAAFIAICLRLIIVLFIKKRGEAASGINFKASKAFYILICFFAVLVLFLGVIGLLEALNPSISLFGIRITNSAVFIKILK